jgi:hypothetical protein
LVKDFTKECLLRIKLEYWWCSTKIQIKWY